MVKAILLAAGESKRLEDKNKLLKIFKKKFLVNHSLNNLIKSNVDKIIIVIGHQRKELKSKILKNKKNIFVINKKYKTGISSSIKIGLKKISKKDKGFIIVHSDMPFIKTSYINKICASINQRKYLVHVLKFKNQIGNPVGFDFSILNKFKKISGDIGAKYMVKRLKNRTKYIHVKSKKIFKDLDRISDFRG
tara:strand:+ start:730 stop:1305 length:576 start_codon:yes stop_codon:yes gene_type:complete